MALNIKDPETDRLARELATEPNAERYADALTSNVGSLHLSAGNAVETGDVIEARAGREGAANLRDLTRPD